MRKTSFSTRQSILSLGVFVVLIAPAQATNGQCIKQGGYAAGEIAASTFFSTREQSKFATNERHYPIAAGATARYCFSRGCTGQLTVTWSEGEQQTLRNLRAVLVGQEAPAAELHFIKIATLQLETWLHGRLASLDAATAAKSTKRGDGYYGGSQADSMAWLAKALGSYDRFDKECATYAMEATQHLLVLANLGLIKHWNVIAPVYRYGVPGHWTAGLENRETCEHYRFDLNSRASVRYDLHKRGQNPAALAMQNPQATSHMLPGMDRNGSGRPTAPSSMMGLGGR